jgi:hypothetical protein
MALILCNAQSGRRAGGLEPDMSFALTLPVAEAALFTTGCLIIHLLRRHAEVVTAVLACLLMMVVLVLGIAGAPEPFLKAQANSLYADADLIHLVN